MTILPALKYGLRKPRFWTTISPPNGDLALYNECETPLQITESQDTEMTRIFHPLLALIASATDRELAKYVQFLKEENKILRSRVNRVPDLLLKSNSTLLDLLDFTVV